MLLGTQRFCFGTCEEDGYCISHFWHTIAVSISRPLESQMGFPASYACNEPIFQWHTILGCLLEVRWRKPLFGEKSFRRGPKVRMKNYVYWKYTLLIHINFFYVIDIRQDVYCMSSPILKNLKYLELRWTLTKSLFFYSWNILCAGQIL